MLLSALFWFIFTQRIRGGRTWSFFLFASLALLGQIKIRCTRLLPPRGFVAHDSAPPFCSTPAKLRQTRQMRTKERREAGSGEGRPQTRTHRQTHTLLKGTMADRDGCSGFSLLADYVNGSQLHDKPLRPFLGRHVFGASRRRLSGILFCRASVHTSKMTLAKNCRAVRGGGGGGVMGDGSAAVRGGCQM